MAHMQEGFADQVPIVFELHGYELAVPPGHPLLQLHTPGASGFQPYRERGLTLAVTALERRAFVWDDPGRFYGRLDLSDEMTVTNLLNYLTQLRHRAVWGFDICAVHESDSAMAGELSAVISEGLLVPLD